jgi:hypothetical protein
MPRNRRRQYGKFQKGLAEVITQILDGQWDHASTERLLARVHQEARIPASRIMPVTDDYGELMEFGATELLLEKLRTTRAVLLVTRDPTPLDDLPDPTDINAIDDWNRLAAEIALRDDVEKLRPRTIHNIPSGRPVDKRRALDPTAAARTGQWVTNPNLNFPESGQVESSYQRRRSDSASTLMLASTIRTVLNGMDESTKARLLWREVMAQMRKQVFRA